MKVDMNAIRQQLSVVAVFGLSALLLFALYSQAHGMMWGFDDWINLKGLSDVSSRGALIDFVSSGIAGPTGRPVSLLAFVPNYADWPDNPIGFVFGSLLWHGMNALLVFNLTYRLLSAVRIDKNAFILAALVSIFWAFLPIHVSSLLLPVQRMVHVSSFFSLVALNIFVCWRLAPSASSWVVTFLAVLTIGVALLLSIYAKESGVNTVSYIAIIELVLLRRPAHSLFRRLWRPMIWLAFLLVPFYLAYETYKVLPVILNGTVWHRDFTHMERLATQPVILWEYLRMILLPRVSAMGPYHDDHLIYGWGMLLPWVATLAWIGVVVAALIWQRSRGILGRVFLFGVSFYLMGHLLESSIIMIELYFEHRNYLPSLGVVLFLVLAVNELAIRFKKTFITCFFAAIFFIFNLFSVQQLTALWGQPLAAAEMWYKMHPNSTRAVQTLANQYGNHAFVGAALNLLDDYSADPSQGRLDVAIQAFATACRFESEGQLRRRYQALFMQLEHLTKPNGIVTVLRKVGEMVRTEACAGIQLEDYNGFLQAMLRHPRIANSPRVKHHIYFELALVEQHSGRMEEYLAYSKSAFRAFPSLTIAQRIATELFASGRYDDSIAWLNEAIVYAPKGPAGQAWYTSLESLRTAILNIQEVIHQAEQEVREKEEQN